MYWWRDNRRTMSTEKLDQQLLALAALYQSCNFVSRLAWKGEYKEDDFIPLLESILNFESYDPSEIYKNKNNLKTGFRYMKKQVIDDIFTRSSETRRYISSLKELVRKVDKDKNISSDFFEKLKQLSADHNNIGIDEKTEQIGEIYQSTFSKIEPRIVVSGDNVHLKIGLNAARIRTALLAGIRSIYLWKQCDGSDLKFFIFKKRYINRIKEIIGTMQN